MNDFGKFQILTYDWSAAVTKTKAKEAIISDKINSFFKGTCSLPTPEELEELEISWGLHVKARQKMNLFIAKIIKKQATKSLKKKSIFKILFPSFTLEN